MLNTITRNRQIHFSENSAQHVVSAAFGWKTLIVVLSCLITTCAYSQYGNTAFGSSALFNNTTGALNSAFGYQSLYANTTGSTNSAFGYISLLSNTTGYENSAFGENSMTNNTTGHTNSAFGSLSLNRNTIGNQNSAFGYGSLLFNTTGSQNSTFGSSSLYGNTTGQQNSAFGYSSLFSNTTGQQNSAFGYSSLYRNTNGIQNSTFGYSSLYNNISGSSNTAFGYSSLFSNSSGQQNSAFGNFSLSNITTGRNNTGIGYNAQVPSSTAYNQVRIGNTAITYAGIQVAWTITSDRRWKQNILSSNLGLGFISKLNPVSYTRIDDESGKTEYGLIAQEVEVVLKEEGVDNSGMLTITDEGMYELRYNDLMAPMIKAIQELKAENDNVKNDFLTSRQENEELKERLMKLELIQNTLVSEIEKMRSKDIQIKEVIFGENQ